MLNNEKNNINNSLDKALGLLRYFTAEQPVRGLSEVARISKIPKATVYRLFNTFEKNGYLTKVDISGKQNQYKLGMKFLELGTLVTESMDLTGIAMPYMRKMRDELNEDVQLVIKDNYHAIYIEKITCSHPVRLYTRKGRRAALNAGACPRAILSFLEDDEIEDIIEQNQFVKYTANTIVDRDDLWQAICVSRKNGYTLSYGEMEPQTIGIAAPVFNCQGKVVAAVSTAGPEQRFGEERYSEIIDATKKAAKNISRELGHNK